MEIKAIQCPNCGSTQKIELRRNRFRCESCGSEYVLDDGQNTVIVQTSAPAQPDAQKSSALRYAGAGIGLVLLILIVVIVYSGSGRSNPSFSGTVPVLSSLPDHRWEWRKSFLFSTSDKKPVLMSIGVRITSHPQAASEETCYIVFTDAVKGSKLKSVPLPRFSTESSVQIREFSNGDIYLIPQSGSIFRVDRNSFAVTDVSSSLFAGQNELGNGVATIAFSTFDNEDGLKLITNDGKNLAFFPLVHKTYTNDELWQAEQGFNTVLPGAKEKTAFAFCGLFNYGESSDNIRMQLIRYRFLDNGGGPKQPVGMLPKGVNDINQKKPRVISYSDFTPGRFYLSQKMMYYDSNYVLIAFQPAAGSASKGDQLQCLDAHTGKILFTTQMPDQTNISAGDAVWSAAGFSVGNQNSAYNIGMDGKFNHLTQPEDYEF